MTQPPTRSSRRIRRRCYKLLDSYLQANQPGAPGAEIPVLLHTPRDARRVPREALLCAVELRTARDGARARDGRRARGRCGRRPDSASSAEPSPGLTSPTEHTDAGAAPFPQELDVMLPKACEALVLVAQCIITISLEAEEQQARLDEGTSTYASFTNMKGYYAHKQHDGEGLVESLIGTHACRVLLFITSDMASGGTNRGAAPARHLPPAHPVRQACERRRDAGVRARARGGRRLGVLVPETRPCAAPRGARARGEGCAGPRRDAGGLPVVMNLCVIDEAESMCVPLFFAVVLFVLWG